MLANLPFLEEEEEGEKKVVSDLEPSLATSHQLGCGNRVLSLYLFLVVLFGGVFSVGGSDPSSSLIVVVIRFLTQ